MMIKDELFDVAVMKMGNGDRKRGPDLRKRLNGNLPHRSPACLLCMPGVPW